MSRSAAPLQAPLDLLRQRRLVRGLPADPGRCGPAGPLLLQGSVIGAALVVLVLVASAFAGLRGRQVSAELDRLKALPAQAQGLERQLRLDQLQLRRQNEANASLGRGLASLSSGSALLTQLAEATPQGVQITEVTVNDQTLTLKGRAADPAPFERVNAMSLKLAQAPLFRPDARVLQMSRPAPQAQASGTPAAPAPVPQLEWTMTIRLTLATLPPARQLSVLQRLEADGMAVRLQDLQRLGVLP